MHTLPHVGKGTATGHFETPSQENLSPTVTKYYAKWPTEYKNCRLPD